MCSGRTGRQEGAELLDARTPLRLDRQVGDEAAQRGIVALGPGDHRGLVDGGVAQEGGLDLPGLDAEAAHLDLPVDPPQELQPPVRQPAHEVAGAIKARSAERAAGSRRARTERAAQSSWRAARRANGSGTNAAAVRSGLPR